MQRNKKIDMIKGVAIILVILGHCLQYGSGKKVLETGDYFHNILFEFIYSFHMPLFMLVSGYLFSFSLNKYNFFEIIKSRISKLLVPICVWSIIPFIIKLCSSIERNFVKIIKMYISTTIRELWFLWAIFYCSLVVLFVSKYTKDSLIVYILGFILTFFITDDRNFSLYKYMYPFFVLGYFGGKYNNKIKCWMKEQLDKKYLIIGIVILYVIMFSFYDYDSYIYISGYSIIGKNVWKQISIDVYRLLIGIVGSVMVVVSINNIYSVLNNKIANLLAYFGKKSMGIYVISGVIFAYILPQITSNLQNINYIIALLESVLVISISIFINWIIGKNTILKCLLLGERVYKL